MPQCQYWFRHKKQSREDTVVALAIGVTAAVLKRKLRGDAPWLLLVEPGLWDVFLSLNDKEGTCCAPLLYRLSYRTVPAQSNKVAG